MTERIAIVGSRDTLGPDEREILARLDPARMSGSALDVFYAFLAVRAALPSSHPMREAGLADMLAERLAMGAQQYGAFDLARDQRDFLAEVVPELLDALVFLAAHDVQQERRRG